MAPLVNACVQTEGGWSADDVSVLDVPYLSHLTDGLRKALLAYDKVPYPYR